MNDADVWAIANIVFEMQLRLTAQRAEYEGTGHLDAIEKHIGEIRALIGPHLVAVG